jgi:hypothetical protein
VDIVLRTWGPLTVLAVAVVLLVVVGGLVNVIVGHETFERFLDDLKLLAGLLGAGTAIGRGARLHATPVKERAHTRRR